MKKYDKPQLDIIVINQTQSLLAVSLKMGTDYSGTVVLGREVYFDEDDDFEDGE